jgi:RNA polymerase sigma-70 factor (ECF subfamily)
VDGFAGCSDRDLVEQIRRGDPDAFAALYRAHVGAVRRAVAESVRDPDTVADAVQETFARALQNLHELRSPERVRSWLVAIGRHLAVDALRAKGREQQLDEEAAATLASADRGPDETAELRELAGLVERGVVSLSPRDATAVALVTHLGLGPSEVAVALGVTVGSAKVIVHRARRRLRDALVLELMVQRPHLACPEFRRLIDESAHVAAARHVKVCERCVHAARDEVELFTAAAPGTAD